MSPTPYKLLNASCYGLHGIKDNSIHAIIADPPYGISYQNLSWDKALPDIQIWQDALRVLKPGGFAAVFSSVRLLHHMMTSLEESGFVIKDVLLWSFINGMPKSRDFALEIDKEFGVKSRVTGEYKYVQGYKKGGVASYKTEKKKFRYSPASPIGNKYKGCGLNLKPAYEPIILVQKPIEKGLTIAQNVIKHGTGVLNIEETRIQYEKGEKQVGHHPHPKGRVPSNIIRTGEFKDGYDKFFLIPKARQDAEPFNTHPTIKPISLMDHLVKLLTWKGQTVLDPFLGSGSTGVSCVQLKRKFYGYEINDEYCAIARKRIGIGSKKN